jgi:hypothetical protein
MIPMNVTNEAPAQRFFLLGEERFAGFCATAAGFCANTAMRHFRAMFFAERAAALAGLNAGPELRAGQLEVGPGKARDDAAGGEADIRAISAIANAIDQLGHVLLGQTRVGAGIACFRAGIAGGDALDVDGMIRGGIYRMRFEHLFDVAHKCSFGCFAPAKVIAPLWFRGSAERWMPSISFVKSV